MKSDLNVPLFVRIKEQTEIALQKGALVPLPTSFEKIHENDFSFTVRILMQLSLKEKDKLESIKNNIHQSNPFLSYDENLFVTNIGKNHVALLNKFNVVENHLLIVTKKFESQENLLTKEDFKAILYCLSEFNGLAFYNGGKEAGASQQHKHLQYVPLPLSADENSIPFNDILKGNSNKAIKAQFLPKLPFLHSYIYLPKLFFRDSENFVEQIYKFYRELLSAVDIKPNGKIQSTPYNLLMTKSWMLLIPRSNEFFETISINSLAFVGSFFVRNKSELKIIKKYGAKEALKAVTFPLK